MQGDPHFGDFHVFARGMHAVGQEDDENLALLIDPDGGTSEAGVAEGALREKVAAGAAFGWDGSAKGARAV